MQGNARRAFSCSFCPPLQKDHFAHFKQRHKMARGNQFCLPLDFPEAGRLATFRMTDVEDRHQSAIRGEAACPDLPLCWHTVAHLTPAEQRFKREHTGPPGRKTALGEGGHLPGRWWPSRDWPHCQLWTVPICFSWHFGPTCFLTDIRGGTCMKERRRGHSRPRVSSNF